MNLAPSHFILRSVLFVRRSFVFFFLLKKRKRLEVALELYNTFIRAVFRKDSAGALARRILSKASLSQFFTSAKKRERASREKSNGVSGSCQNAKLRIGNKRTFRNNPRNMKQIKMFI